MLSNVEVLRQKKKGVSEHVMTAHYDSVNGLLVVVRFMHAAEVIHSYLKIIVTIKGECFQRQVSIVLCHCCI